ncbi:23623_t:CDS:2 [Dentiscutata erythropus]|uniref:23623_t:CDS:1 n=1 Tax=Dentiscutata erythropus TaxID=1348616 RepID=A0A9N8ZD26_9GLOM|nr:23623_t:CDS:2 [Dentiscutata erythropus]
MDKVSVKRRRKSEKIEENIKSMDADTGESMNAQNSIMSDLLSEADIGNSENKKKSNKSAWTTDQRMQLFEAIIKRLPSPLDWKEISGDVDGKSHTQCYDQWRKRMLSDLKKSVASE